MFVAAAQAVWLQVIVHATFMRNICAACRIHLAAPRRRRARIRRLRNSSRTADNAEKKTPVEDPSSGEHHRTSLVMADSGIRHLEKIVAARPEAILMIDAENCVLDSNLNDKLKTGGRSRPWFSLCIGADLISIFNC